MLVRSVQSYEEMTTDPLHPSIIAKESNLGEELQLNGELSTSKGCHGGEIAGGLATESALDIFEC